MAANSYVWRDPLPNRATIGLTLGSDGIALSISFVLHWENEVDRVIDVLEKLKPVLSVEGPRHD